MNRNQLILVLFVAIFLGGIGLWLNFRREIPSTSTNRIGQSILQDFPINQVEGFRLVKGTQTLTIRKKNDDWKIIERSDYPADVNRVNDLVRRCWDAHILQKAAAGKSQWSRLEVDSPTENGMGTLVEFQTKEGKPLVSLILGKNPENSQRGIRQPRYVRVLDRPEDIWLVTEAPELQTLEPKGWFDPQFFRIERIRSVTLIPDPSQKMQGWKAGRSSETNDFEWLDGKKNEKPDSLQIQNLISSLGSLSFVDVAVPDISTETTGLSKPAWTIRAETFEDLNYEFQLGKKSTTGDYYFSGKVDGKIPEQRVKAPGEKPEDAVRLDTAFTNRQKELREKLQKQKTFERWTYLIAASSVESLTKDRKSLVKK